MLCHDDNYCQPSSKVKVMETEKQDDNKEYNLDNKESNKNGLEYTFDSVKELQKLVRNKLENGFTTEQLIINFTGEESIKVLIKRIFTKLSPSETSANKYLINPAIYSVKPLSNPKKEQLYQKLKQDLEFEDIKEVSKSGENPPSFQSTNDLLCCLLEDLDVNVKESSARLLTPTPNTYLADPRILKRSGKTFIKEVEAPLQIPKSDDNSSNDSDILFICEYNNSLPDPCNHIIDEFSAALPSLNTEQTVEEVQLQLSLEITNLNPINDNLPLGEELNNIRASRPSIELEDIPISDLVNLDLEKDLHQYLPTVNQPFLTITTEETQNIPERQEELVESENDSFYSAKSSFSPCAHTKAIPRSPDGFPKAQLRDEEEFKLPEPVVNLVTDAPEKIQTGHTEELIPGPTLTKEEDKLFNRFNCKHLYIKLESDPRLSQMVLQLEKCESKRNSVTSSNNTSIIFEECTPKTLKGKNPKSEETTIRTSPRKKVLELANQDTSENHIAPQVTKKKTRIKARKPTEEELALAQSSQVPPQQIIMQRISIESPDYNPNSEIEPTTSTKSLEQLELEMYSDISESPACPVINSSPLRPPPSVISSFVSITSPSHSMLSIEDELEDALLGSYPVFTSIEAVFENQNTEASEISRETTLNPYYESAQESQQEIVDVAVIQEEEKDQCSEPDALIETTKPSPQFQFQVLISSDAEAAKPSTETPNEQPREDAINPNPIQQRTGPKSKTKPLQTTDCDESRAASSIEKVNIRKRRRKQVLYSDSDSASNVSPTRQLKLAKTSPVKNKSPVPQPISIEKQQPPPDVPYVPDESESSNSSESSSDIFEYDDEKDLTSIIHQGPDVVKWLSQISKELDKVLPDPEKMSLLMDKTKVFRQKFLHCDNYDMQRGLKMFPALKDFNFIKMEYSKMNFKSGMSRMELIEQGLQKLFVNCTNVRKRPGQVRHPLWERALAQATNFNSLTEQMKKILGMTCLCFHLAENNTHKNLFYIKEKKEPVEWKLISTPRIVVNEDQVFDENAKKMWIYAEGSRHIRVPNLYEGVLTVYALHYVFNIEYERTLKPVFKQFDKLARI